MIAPAYARRSLEFWHRAECWVAVSAFAFIAIVLILDVIGREAIGPLSRLFNLDIGPTGIPASQRLSVYALVVGSFCGVGIATATASHLVPRVAFGWVPKGWDAGINRLADVITGLFLIGVAWYGGQYVLSSMSTDLRAPSLNWPVWPFQMAIPLGFLSASGRYLAYAVWPDLRPKPPEFQE